MSDSNPPPTTTPANPVDPLRLEYLRSQSGDLTTYSGMIGDGFAQRVNLLAQVIRDAHHSSLGRYKERLLQDTIARFLPERFKVATGFVAFPKRRRLSGPTGNSDHMNLYDHEVSAQLDLMIYDAMDYPTIFRDGDFAVIRPEAVRAIVEVKGTLATKEVRSAVDSLLDYARKWRECREFYKSFGDSSPVIPKLKRPRLFLMGWQPYVSPDGVVDTDGARLREQITETYARTGEDFRYLPLLTAAYLYNDTIVTLTGRLEDSELIYGYQTRRGKLVRYLSDGTPELAGDGTVADLIALIQGALGPPWNFVLSYRDQNLGGDLFPHAQQGFSKLIPAPAAFAAGTAWVDDQ